MPHKPKIIECTASKLQRTRETVALVYAELVNNPKSFKRAWILDKLAPIVREWTEENR